MTRRTILVRWGITPKRRAAEELRCDCDCDFTHLCRSAAASTAFPPRK